MFNSRKRRRDSSLMLGNSKQPSSVRVPLGRSCLSQRGQDRRLRLRLQRRLAEQKFKINRKRAVRVLSVAPVNS